MVQIKVFSKTTCPACVAAKELLKSKGASYEEVVLDNKPEELRALIEKTGMKTVPQIFINNELIGGCSDLMTLDRDKKLDALLKA